MGKPIMVYPAGTILLCEEGEYSDFGYCGQLVTLKEVDLPKLATEFKTLHKDKDKWKRPGPNDFVAWLVAQQHCAPLNCETVYIGSYGRIEIGEDSYHD